MGIITVTNFCFWMTLASAYTTRRKSRRYARAAYWTHFWGRAGARLMGLEIELKGNLPRAGSMLVSNHLGYADIAAISSLVRCLFVAKGEIRTWPFLGSVARSSQQVLVNRQRGKDLTDTVQQIEDRLSAGQSVCVFLEGTSTGGDRVLPFMPSLLKGALTTFAPIVPVTLRWRATQPGLSVQEDLAYWRDEHHLGKHLWRLLGLNGFTVEVIFGEPVAPTASPNRKGLAQIMRDEIIRNLDLSDQTEKEMDS